jgi:hypothetical protein
VTVDGALTVFASTATPDRHHPARMPDLTPPAFARLAPAHRTFVDALESRNATDPNRSVPLTDLPRLSASELAARVDSGLVREAADWRYYLHRANTGPLTPAPGAWGASPSRTSGRTILIRSVVFWLALLLIPILFVYLQTGTAP